MGNFDKPLPPHSGSSGENNLNLWRVNERTAYTFNMYTMQQTARPHWP